ncbi:RHS repeat-associated core domain-containing protein [Puteibacter caeruleilacunae]|nr:RHS repeat-associated core domain-containing protein [Puteibacter caeruleilacunae]
MNEQHKYIQTRMLRKAIYGRMQLYDFSIKFRLLLVFMMLGIVTMTKAQKGTPDPAKNYIQSIEVLNKTGNKTVETINYFDGLGRSSQVVKVQGSPGGKDVVVPVDYDDYGRQKKTYLPYVSGTSNGVFQENAIASQLTFYANPDPTIAQTTVPYSEVEFEPSPLNRVMKQGAPGETWKIDGSHTQHFEYSSNASEEVLCFEVSGDNLVNSGGILGSDGLSYFEKNRLFKNIVKDENWVSGLLHTTEEFKDKQGKVVLKRSYVEENGQVVPAETYYVYDDFNLLRFVIPPGAVSSISSDILVNQSNEVQIYNKDTELTEVPAGKNMLVAASGSTITLKSGFTFTANSSSTLTITPANYGGSLIYAYKYDHKKRMIEKHLPGAEPVYMVYDARDRLILSQDGNQRKSDEWTYFEYDSFSRQIETGYIVHKNKSREKLQDELKDSTNYSPEGTMLVKTFYDNYNWSGSGYSPKPFEEDSEKTVSAYHDASDPNAKYFGNVKGQVTGTVRSVLGRNKTLVSTIYYDKQYRPIQTVSEILVDDKIGKEVASTKYWGYTSQPEKTVTWQNINTVGEKYVCEVMEYDDQGRLLKVKHGIGTTTPTTVLAEMNYNELGELIEKNLHGGIESIDYRYNIRGWLTSINNAELDKDGGVTDDDDANHFGMELSYDQAIQGANITGEQQYNGNIGSVVWKSGDTDEQKKGYGYAYDGLNRLKAADFEVNTSTNVWSSGNNFDVTGGAPKGIDYDIRGNIKNLKRYGNSSSYENDLVYSYSGNQLASIQDNAKGINGSYSYDANGNMTKDGYRGFDVAYNRLNLPKKVSKGDDVVDYFYTADGTKVMKQTTKAGSTTMISYAGSFVYNGNQLDYILTSEGMYKGNKYQYNLKDHLGNVRVVINEGGAVVSKSDYYPFGKLHDRQSVDFVKNKYLYNGKEIQDEQLGGVLLDWYDYGARMYDAEIGRWHCVDPLADKYYSNSPFSYTLNNPIIFVDPDGRKVKIFYFQSGVKAGIGLNVGYSIQAGLARDDKGITRFEINSNQYLNNNIEEGTGTPEVYLGGDLDLFTLGYATDFQSSTFKGHLNKMSLFSLNASLVDVSFTGNAIGLEMGLSIGAGLGNSGNADQVTSISYSLEEAAHFARNYGTGQISVKESGAKRGKNGKIKEHVGHLIFTKSNGTVIDTGIQVTSYSDPESINRFWETYLYRYANEEDREDEEEN